MSHGPWFLEFAAYIRFFFFFATFVDHHEVSNEGASGSVGTSGIVSPPGCSIMNAPPADSKIGNKSSHTFEGGLVLF